MKLSFAIIAVAFAAALLLSGCVESLPNVGQLACESTGGRWGCLPCNAGPGEVCTDICKYGCLPPKDGTPPAPPAGGEQSPPGNGTQQPYACTADAKVCPDGSYVGRMGPNCEFAPCPSQDAALVSDIAANPEKYANKNLTVKGTVRLEGSLFGGNAEFYLDGGNASVQTNSWAPFTVAACPPGASSCNQPKTMSYYIGKKVIAYGKFMQIDGEYVLKVENTEVVSETAGMTRELCESARGSWNGCASACRGAPPGTMCTEQCVLQCECGGIAGFGCPSEYHCADYLPVGAADAMGVCRKNLYQ